VLKIGNINNSHTPSVNVTRVVPKVDLLFFDLKRENPAYRNINVRRAYVTLFRDGEPVIRLASRGIKGEIIYTDIGDKTLVTRNVHKASLQCLFCN
jgi:hypothetical protein